MGSVLTLEDKAEGRRVGSASVEREGSDGGDRGRRLLRLLDGAQGLGLGVHERIILRPRLAVHERANHSDNRACLQRRPPPGSGQRLKTGAELGKGPLEKHGGGEELLEARGANSGGRQPKLRAV